MSDLANNELSDIDREKLIEILTEELPSLRAKVGLSQDELSNLVGISRQTYSAIETRKRPMTWKVYLSLLFIFDQNEKTSATLKSIGAYPENLRKTLNIDRRTSNVTSGS